eukprot:9126806-Pyramimonas_sp.AAC.1
MEALGNLLDGKGSAKTMVDHRRRKAEQLFWVRSKQFLGPGAASAKIEAWSRSVAASALHCRGCWAVDKTLLQRLRRWELRWARKMLGMKRKMAEGTCSSTAALRS